MNRTKIEWVCGPNGEPGYTWNPVTGCLGPNADGPCPYCYARRFAERGMGEYGKHPKGERFLPRFHPERLDEPQKVKQPSRIFVCSMADIFSSGVHYEWLAQVRDAVESAPQHTYLWLTKASGNYAYGYWRGNDWIGATVTEMDQLEGALYGLEQSSGAGVRFISFEPLLGPITLPDEAADILDWIIIGAQTGPGAKPINIEWISGIKNWAGNHGIPVFIKNNCGGWSRYQEYPRDGG